MKVAALQCPACHDIIYSRARHDMRRCSCGKIAIDGGRSYCKVSFHPSVNGKFKHLTLDLDIDDETLYDDWNYSLDKYGLIKRGESDA